MRAVTAILSALMVLTAADAVRAVPSADGVSPGHWGRWRDRWTRWADEEQRGGVSLARLAHIDSTRGLMMDSLCAALRNPSQTPPPTSPSDVRWAREVLLFGLAEGDLRFTRLAEANWTPGALGGWNTDGAFTLPVALTLADAARRADALRWLESAPVESLDRPFAASLRVEIIRTLGDTIGAGTTARALIDAGSGPAWTRLDLEEAVIRGNLAAADTAAARAAIASFSGRVERRSYWLAAQRRLAQLQGRSGRAEALAWNQVAEYPGGPAAEALLRSLVSSTGSPAGALTSDQRRALLAVCESRNDVARFRGLAESLSAGLTAAGRDSLLLREARLAYRARDYAQLIARARTQTWRGIPRTEGAWDLLVARALRNTSQPDSMAGWYERGAERGTGEDRATAYWEWAREFELLRRFSEADSLYSRYLSGAGADRREAAMVRQGIDSFARKNWVRAVARLQKAALGADSEASPAAWFWLYRVHLASLDTAAAHAALVNAAGAGSGYYALRARSALRLAGRGVPWNDPTAFWRAQGRAGDAPALKEAALPPRRGASGTEGATPGAASWRPSPALGRLRDRLLLFRRCARRAWAEAVQSEILRTPALGSGMNRVVRLQELHLPDLATRAAVQAKLSAVGSRYPLPFAAEIAAVARTRTLAPEWVWAVMRQESFFENSVVSQAGAVGLMQLMEATAKVTAEKHRLTSEPLTSPQVNLTLGATHLSDLAAEEPGQWPVVVAAYNAGLPNARRWRLPGDDPDFYIEMIGYRETRDYVQKVLEAYWTYREILRKRS